MVFFTADTHFSHGKIIEYCKRPFASAQEMNEAMIDRWNSAVQSGDTVFHLGDFGIQRSFLHTCLITIFNTLKGRKILVIGNHDKQPVFDLPWEKQVNSTSIRVNGQEIRLKHFPTKGAWLGEDKGAWHLYGHVHGRGRRNGLSLDAGVDCWEFRPVEFWET